MKSILTPYLQIETMRHGSLEERTGKEPEYVECQIVWKKTGDDKRATIKLSLSISDDDNEDNSNEKIIKSKIYSKMCMRGGHYQI